MSWELPERHETEGGTVRWARLGRGSPVVLLHGTPFSSVVWREVATALSRDHEVFVYDLLGYGRSTMRDGQDVSLVGQQRIFAELLERWGLAEPAVVAHDIGGAVALRTALLGGARYGRLALLDAVAVRPWGSPFFRLVREHAAVFGALPAHLHEALVRRYVRSAAHREPTPAVLDELVGPWLGEAGQQAFYRQIAQADERWTREFEDRLGALGCPVLVGWGEHDDWLPPERGAQLAAAIPGARHERLSGAGHLVQHDAPAELAVLLARFLRP
ncbi:alpha/beta hydrolase [Saccharopolyspora cebuensis]|uniref:Alpha/beta fold hydrolase n=1 Tax=Saccharopolyspora cebuensis TaxID=418759 RepID=A0ABV4CJZ6_9PSEU